MDLETHILCVEIAVHQNPDFAIETAIGVQAEWSVVIQEVESVDATMMVIVVVFEFKTTVDILTFATLRCFAYVCKSEFDVFRPMIPIVEVFDQFVGLFFLMTVTEVRGGRDFFPNRVRCEVFSGLSVIPYLLIVCYPYSYCTIATRVV